MPQVYADQPEDLFEAQGYLAALDRFYEMDVRRRAASGPAGRALRGLRGRRRHLRPDRRLPAHGRAGAALQSPSTRRYLDAYASGVNAYLRGRSPGQVSLEYTVLEVKGADARPEEWTAVDSLAILKLFGWQLGGQRRRGARAGPDRRRRRDRPGRRPGSRLPAGRARPDRAGGTVVGKAFDPAAPARRPRRAGPGGAVPPARRARRRRRRPAQGDAHRAVRLRRRARLELLGGERVAHGERCADALQRPAPGHRDPVAVRPGGAALPTVARGARSTSAASRSPASPASSSAATPRPPGA